jgi:hypothetical protein
MRRLLGLLLLLALAPTLATPGSAQPPPKAPSAATAPPEAPPAAREPAGLRLSKADGAPRLIAWGTTASDYDAAYKGPIPTIWMKGPRGETLSPAPYGWKPYFGADGRKLDATLSFYQDRFCSFSISFNPAADFDFVLATMLEALGTPSTRTSGTVKNRMGAEFDQEEVLWELPNVDVFLSKRSSKIDRGALDVTYKPLAPPPAPKSGTAPF